jgi:hypothetical protein
MSEIKRNPTAETDTLTRQTASQEHYERIQPQTGAIRIHQANTTVICKGHQVTFEANQHHYVEAPTRLHQFSINGRIVAEFKYEDVSGWSIDLPLKKL